MSEPQEVGTVAVALRDSPDLTSAGPLASELLAARGSNLEVDAAGVRRLGAQCLQVLLSARATWMEDGLAFRLLNPSPEFNESLRLMGCSDLGDQPQD